MSITIYDVAKKAKVGIGTVSRAINDSPHISPHTRDKVLQVVKELKYQPHAMAQGLARKKTKIIACIVPFFTGYFFVELLRSIQRDISAYGYDLILYSVDEMNKKEVFLKRALREKKVDGVLVFSLPINDNDANIFINNNFPIVLIDSYHRDLDSISIQNQQGAYLATRHLIELGHTRIAMITGHIQSIPAQRRLEGYKIALHEDDIEFKENYVLYIDSSEVNADLMLNDGFNEKSGYQLMLRLLESGTERPTAVFVSSDIQAIGAMKAIREKGLSIPDDIAVVGFDDIELARLLGLTTIHQPIAEMGHYAVKRLIDRMNGHNADHYECDMETHLVIRRTCGSINNESNDFF
ncbi:LacI family DNA-binding transcriptional regulator [candidate division KSB1 bacterium]|nr:LacI family DNA-binding transcriptional regulator [candidate division KSB1 bacterium]